MSRVTESALPFSHHLVDLMNAKDEELEEIKNTFGLGLSIEELRYVRDHYIVREKKATDF